MSQATIHKIEAGETTRSKFLFPIAMKLELPLEEIDPELAMIASRTKEPVPIIPGTDLLENQTLHLLRDLRAAIDRNHDEMLQFRAETKKRFDSLQQAMLGESVLGRYATAEFEERLTALEAKVAALEGR